MAADGLTDGRSTFDEDGALRLSGIDALVSVVRSDWPGVSLDGGSDGAPEVARAHVTCPKCASWCTADAEVCWNCSSALR